uniref:Uncharacterized protein n=1 Tax=Phlebotomus papatasi TaxID=29031 RepID=A0A1B0F086_PHLPP
MGDHIEISSSSDEDELVAEVCRLRKANQILKAHCCKYQSDIVKLQEKVNKLEREKQESRILISQNLLKHSELTVQLMSKISRREPSVEPVTIAAITSPVCSNPRPPIRRILIQENVNAVKSSVMKNGRPRRQAAPSNLRERDLLSKLRY